MEASVAGGAPAGAPGAEGAQAGAEGADAQQGGGLDLSGLTDHMDQMGERIADQLAERFGGEEQGEYEGDGEEDGFFGEDGEFDPAAVEDQLYGEDGEIDPQAAYGLIAEMASRQASEQVEARVQEQIAPMMEMVTDMRNRHNADALIAQYPQLNDPEVAEQVTGRVAEQARALGYDDQGVAMAMQNPGFIELVIKAGMAEQASRGELAGQRSELELESGGTAGLGSASADVGRSIVQADQKGGFWT